jgi:hypothetical protein
LPNLGDDPVGGPVSITCTMQTTAQVIDKHFGTSRSHQQRILAAEAASGASDNDGLIVKSNPVQVIQNSVLEALLFKLHY